MTKKICWVDILQFELKIFIAKLIKNSIATGVFATIPNEGQTLIEEVFRDIR